MTEKKVKVQLTMVQWSNLQKLHDYLVTNKKKVEPHFDMSAYIRLESGNHPRPIEGKQITKCGSVGCLIGHGVIAGIPAYSKDRSWGVYADRVFGTECLKLSNGGPLYEWLFDSDWTYSEPTLGQAIKRLSFVLKHKAVPA